MLEIGNEYNFAWADNKNTKLVFCLYQMRYAEITSCHGFFFPPFFFVRSSIFTLHSCFWILYSQAVVAAISLIFHSFLDARTNGHLYVCSCARKQPLTFIYNDHVCVRACATRLNVHVCKMKLIHFFQVILFCVPSTVNNLRKVFSENCPTHADSVCVLRKLKSNRANRNAVVAAAAPATAAFAIVITTTVRSAEKIWKNEIQQIVIVCVCEPNKRKKERRNLKMRRTVTVAAIKWYTNACTRKHTHTHAEIVVIGH